MAVKKKSAKRAKKEDYWVRLQEVVGKYKNCLFINADNVSSKQISNIRCRLREIGAYMIMGKNTLMKKALDAMNQEPDEKDPNYKELKAKYQFNTNVEKITGQLRGNINCIFTNGDLGEVKNVLDTEVRESPAKAGMLAPKNVFVKVGATGLDPKQTSFFQTLQIQTKIFKGQIDIVAEKQVIFEGTKVDSTQAALLDKLKIYPFEYKMHVTKILQDGNLFDAAVLDLNMTDIINKFKNGISNMASLSLGAGVPSKASAPHSLLNGFKNLVAVSAMSGFEFPQATKMLEAAKNAPAAASGPAATSAAVAEVVEEKKEEPEDVDMGNLFGGDDDEY